MYLGREKVQRLPTQDRSRASLDRMLDAVERLWAERKGGHFTLAEVSERARVSVGSIYLRFGSKRELVRAAQARLLALDETRHISLIAKLSHGASSVSELVDRLIDGLAEALWSHSELMRTLTVSSETDEITQASARRSHEAIERAFCQAISRKSLEIDHPQPEKAASFVFQLSYGALARQCGSRGPQPEYAPDRVELKANLKSVCIMFLLGCGKPEAPSAALSQFE